jgi:hypothetical protein
MSRSKLAVLGFTVLSVLARDAMEYWKRKEQDPGTKWDWGRFLSSLVLALAGGGAGSAMVE